MHTDEIKSIKKSSLLNQRMANAAIDLTKVRLFANINEQNFSHKDTSVNNYDYKGRVDIKIPSKSHLLEDSCLEYTMGCNPKEMCTVNTMARSCCAAPMLFEFLEFLFGLGKGRR